jgi:hypothetical protein
MSDLEHQARPILEPMIKGRPVALSTIQQTVIAKWMMKTAVTQEFALQRSPRFFRPTDRRALYRDGALPKDALVSLGLYSGTYSIWSMQTPLAGESREGSAKVAISSYATTLVIGRLAMQLFAFRTVGNRHPMLLRIPGKDAAVNVWPTTLVDQRWPKPVYFLTRASSRLHSGPTRLIFFHVECELQ